MIGATLTSIFLCVTVWQVYAVHVTGSGTAKCHADMLHDCLLCHCSGVFAVALPAFSFTLRHLVQ